ncbi:MAG: cytochrome BD ubiquinol oxidase subunit I [Bdellovibrionales bacterium GWB1_55_8]|nr:MAG: cytochrome BD ubiquinol oxidase subunit I [Bdellovibrionales bacterium GWB1_55_8]
MDNILFARWQMGISLVFHIIFACIGIAMPLMMVISEYLWHKTQDNDFLLLTKAWAKGTAVFFAVGAVSGTVLSFELGLLFPEFMRHAGGVIGMPFSLEGFAFFTEGIFLGIYLYGWDRISKRMHLFAGIIVAISGASSAVFVIMANAWMNTPTGFRLENGVFTDVDPIAAMLNPSSLHLISHMLLAAYMATGFAVAAIHAYVLLKFPNSGFHKKALAISLFLTVPCAVLQPAVGHFAGMQVAKNQPMKLAAMESQFKTEKGAPLRIGGIPDAKTRTTSFAIEIPGGLSFLANGDFGSEVKGLEEFPETDWPHEAVHYAFQFMVALGSYLLFISLWAALTWVRKGWTDYGRKFLIAAVIGGPMGFLAMEFGWIVTEMGRQPWVIYNIMRTSDSVTPMPGLFVPMTVFTLIYLALGVTVISILRRHVKASPVYAERTKEGA